jgi:hypothetical protein
LAAGSASYSPDAGEPRCTFHDKVFLRLPDNKKLVDILNQFQTFATISTAQTA